MICPIVILEKIYVVSCFLLFQRLKVKTVLYFLKYVSSHFKSLIHPFLEGDTKIKYPMDTYSIIYGGNTYVLSVQLRNRVLSRVLAAQKWECVFCGAEGADYIWSQNLWVQFSPLLQQMLFSQLLLPRLNLVRIPMT